MIRELATALPGKAVVARVGAHLPPPLKNAFVNRVLWAIARRSDASEFVTNFGMSNRYAIQVPLWGGSTLLYGKPSHYEGERGALLLAAALSSLCSGFVDIGANLGYFLFWLHAVRPQTRLYYFEANASLFARLRENLTANGIRATGYPVAIGGYEGSATFHIDLDDPSSSSLETFFAQRHQTEAVTVPVTTFSRFVQDEGLTNLLVKVDVEDAEFQFLEGADSALHRIRYLIMEVLGPAVRRGFHREMISRGLKAYYIDDLALRHSPDGSFRYVAPQYNWLYCRETPPELRAVLRNTRLKVIA